MGKIMSLLRRKQRETGWLECNSDKSDIILIYEWRSQRLMELFAMWKIKLSSSTSRIINFKKQTLCLYRLQ